MTVVTIDSLFLTDGGTGNPNPAAVSPMALICGVDTSGFNVHHIHTFTARSELNAVHGLRSLCSGAAVNVVKVVNVVSIGWERPKQWGYPRHR